MKIILLAVGANLLAWTIYYGSKLFLKYNVQRVKEKSEVEYIQTGKEQALNYNVYIMQKKEKAMYIVLAVVFLFIVAYVFYHSVIISFLATPLSLFFPEIRKREIIEKRKRNLNLQFKEALLSLSSSLYAGKSLESAFKQVLKDLSILYPDPHTDIIREFQQMVKRIDMNENLEEVLSDFADRSGLEDIENFTSVIVISKRNGGDLIEVVKNTTNIIGDKLQMKQEIDTMLAQRRFDQKVLNIMPVAMILLLTVSTGDYMNPVFNTLEGRIVMTFAVMLLALALYISKRIIDIEV